MQATVEQPTVGRGLLEFVSSRVDEGQRELAHFIKLKLSASGHTGAERLDYAEDDPFLAPEWFAFFSESDTDRDRRENFEDTRICGTDIRYSNSPKGIYQPICRRACGGAMPGGGSDHSSAIARALEIIGAVDADWYRCLLAVTRQIVTFSAEDGDSFATIGAHGAVFLRAPRECDEVFFIEDLAHQCGHLLFNAITLDRGELIAINPNTPLGELIGDPSEVRTLYVTLHGVFTECLMSIVLAGSCGIDCFDKRQRHELMGRLSLIMKRLHLDLGRIRELDAFTSAGGDLLESFREVFDQVLESERADILSCDLRNQPYSFCYELFAELNG